MTDFCALAANGSLQISGGLLPGISDKQITLYAGAKNKAIPIEVDGKMGYSSAANVVIDQATQFTTKAYVDSKSATAAAEALKLVDNNQADGNKYELKIDNNQLEFSRGATSEDIYLKLYGSTTDSTDGIVQETNRNNWFYDSTD